MTVEGPRMEHTRLRKPLCGEFETTGPGVPVPLTTALERLSPVAEHALPENPHTVEVSRYSIAVEVPLYD
jgi:hypothetical protein